MSSFLDPKSSSNFGIDQELPSGHEAEFLSLDPRKNAYCEGESTPFTLTTPKSTYIWIFRQGLLVVWITVFLISISSYDPSRPHLASHGTFSKVCFPTVSRLNRKLSIQYSDI